MNQPWCPLLGSLSIFGLQTHQNSPHTLFNVTLHSNYIHCHVDNGLLLWFVSNPTAFRDVIWQCEAVISGSSALKVFLGQKLWNSGDLDLYVRRCDGYQCVWPNSCNQQLTICSNPPGYQDVLDDQKVHRIMIFE